MSEVFLLIARHSTHTHKPLVTYSGALNITHTPPVNVCFVCFHFPFFVVVVVVVVFCGSSLNFCTLPSLGLLRLQQIYQELKPGNETFRVQMVKRIANVTMAIEFLHTMEDLGFMTLCNCWQRLAFFCCQLLTAYCLLPAACCLP